MKILTSPTFLSMKLNILQGGPYKRDHCELNFMEFLKAPENASISENFDH